MSADHVTVWRWVQRYAPELDRRLRSHLKPTNKSWRVDETYIRVKGKWTYLYRAVDSTGASIDFLLSARRDAAAAKRFFQKALCASNHPTPRVINVDRNPSYPPVVEALKSEGTLQRRCRLRPVQYLNNILEQDHRAIKRRVRASQGFRSFWGAYRTIQANQLGNANYLPAPPVTEAFQVTKAAQTIAFGPLANQPFGTLPFTVSATASSGLAVSFASTTKTMCTVSGGTVTLVVVGKCTINATQAGNANYAAAPPVSQSFQVTKASQSIAFGPLANQPFGAAPFAVSATASSGLAVSFSSTTQTICTVSGDTVTLVAVGKCTIYATQAGNADYSAATPVSQSFQVTKASQTIAFGPLANQPFGAAPFVVSAAASSGLSVSFSSTTSTICAVSGNTVTLVAVGRCTIRATQPGNADYAAATPVTQSFQVTKAN